MKSIVYVFSAALVAALTPLFFMEGNVDWTAFVPVIPLVLYCGEMARRAWKAALTQVEIDSVYYLGFLITLASLAKAVSQYGNSTDSKGIMWSFMISLMTTFIGLLGRSVFQIASQHVDVKWEEETKKNVERLRKLGWSLVDVSSLLERYVEEVDQHLGTAVKSMEKRAGDVVTSTVIAPAEQVGRALTALSETSFRHVASAKTFFQDASFETEVKELRGQLTNTVRGLTKAAETVSGLVANLQESTRGLSDVNQRTNESVVVAQALASGAREAHGEIQKLSGAFVELKESIVATEQASAGVRESIELALGGIDRTNVSVRTGVGRIESSLLNFERAVTSLATSARRAGDVASSEAKAWKKE